jgi:hypothetical protein
VFRKDKFPWRIRVSKGMKAWGWAMGTNVTQTRFLTNGVVIPPRPSLSGSAPCSPPCRRTDPMLCDPQRWIPRSLSETTGLPSADRK